MHTWDDRRLEESSLNYLHSRRQMFYDGWVLFLSPGKAKRARSVNPHFASSLPLPEKIAFCERTYRRLGLPLLFRITPFAQPGDLDAVLEGAGFLRHDPTLVLGLALDTPPQVDPAMPLAFDAPLPEVFGEEVGRLRGSPPGQRQAHAERLTGSPLDVIPLVARDDGVVVAAGLVCVDGPFAGIFDVITAEDRRRQGVGSALIARLLTKAWERGARWAYLQVDEQNAAALSIYRRFGFATRYGYHYRVRPGESR